VLFAPDATVEHKQFRRTQPIVAAHLRTRLFYMNSLQQQRSLKRCRTSATTDEQSRFFPCASAHTCVCTDMSWPPVASTSEYGTASKRAPPVQSTAPGDENSSPHAMSIKMTRAPQLRVCVCAHAITRTCAVLAANVTSALFMCIIAYRSVDTRYRTRHYATTAAQFLGSARRRVECDVLEGATVRA
jgi:hypothetical protein